MKKNDSFTVRMDAATVEGFGVCRIEGRAVFVPGALPEELWEVRILKVTETAVWGKGLRLLEASPHRIENNCPNPCGGCTLRHADYEEELQLKQAHVDDCLRRIGGQNLCTECIHPSPQKERYRNKAVFAVGMQEGKAAFGFYRPRSHDLVPVRDCLLQSEHCIRAAQAVTDFLNEENIQPYDEGSHRGTLRHIFYRESASQTLLCLVSARGFGSRTDALTSFLRERCPELTGIVLNINKTAGNTVLAGDFYTLWGEPFIKEMICGVEFTISPQAFMQVNIPQAEAIYRKVIEYARGSERVLDLYCGAGTISLCLAKAGISVTGVEIVPEAIENARQNAERNGIRNAEFICSDASDFHIPYSPCIIVDPPRKGLSEEVIKNLETEKLIYVSCNPATLARDLKRLSERGYESQNAEAYDMFPRTGHVETVCLLSKLSEAKHHISVQVDMDELDLTAAESKATYEEIQEWVQEKYGFHVTHLNIAKTKRKCGIIERQNYNLPKSENSRSPETPKEKEEAIIDAFLHFKMM